MEVQLAVLALLEKEPICDRRGYQSLAKYDGTLDSFGEWRFATRGFPDREPAMKRRS